MSPESQSRISFQIEDRQQGRKTDLLRVWDLRKAKYLGEVAWIKTGRRYVFHQTSIATIIAKKKVGDTITITVYRVDNAGNGKSIDLKVTLQKAPGN